MGTPSDLLPLREAADLAGTTPAYLRVLIQRGQLHAEKRVDVARGLVRNYVSRSEVERYFAEHPASPSPH